LRDQVVLNILGDKGLAEIEEENFRHAQPDDSGDYRGSPIY